MTRLCLRATTKNLILKKSWGAVCFMGVTVQPLDSAMPNGQPLQELILGLENRVLHENDGYKLIIRQFPLGNRFKNVIQTCHDAWGLLYHVIDTATQDLANSNPGHGGSLSVIRYSGNPMTWP